MSSKRYQPITSNIDNQPLLKRRHISSSNVSSLTKSLASVDINNTHNLYDNQDTYKQMKDLKKQVKSLTDLVLDMSDILNNIVDRLNNIQYVIPVDGVGSSTSEPSISQSSNINDTESTYFS